MAGQAEQVVTGDAVVLDVQIAQLPVRALSALIDIAVIFVGYIAGVMLWATHPEPVRSRAVGRGADHLHRADDRRLSADIRKRDARPDAGQDGARTARGVRRRQPGALPPSPVPGTGVGDRDLDVLRRTRGDLQPAVVEGQTHRGCVRRHRRGQRARAEASAAPGDAAVAGVVGVVAATVGTGSRAGRAGPPIPLSGTAVGPSDPRADGTSHRR